MRRKTANIYKSAQLSFINLNGYQRNIEETSLHA